MKITKRILATLLSLTLVASLCPAVAAADPVSFEKQVVGTSAPNIEVNLFNYGNQINNDSFGTGTAAHFRSELSAYELDGIDDTSPCSYNYQTFAEMADLDADGYPVVEEWSVIVQNTLYAVCSHTGSWEYLFDKSITASTEAPANSNYGVKRYEVADLKLFSYDDSTGYYSYDSRYNAAEYDYATKTLASYNYALRQTYMADRVCNQGAFLPFNQVAADFSNVTRLTDGSGAKAYSGSNPGNGVTGLKPGDRSDGYFNNGSEYGPADLYLRLSEAPSNLFALNSTSYGGQKADLAFGMSVEFDFYMPEGGKVEDASGNLTDMVYEFSGDDDLVVYVDGKPALNLAGHHEAVRGTINFATGAVTIYEDGKTWEESNYRSSGLGLKLGLDKDLPDLFGSDWKTNEFATGSVHTVQIFYMERVGGSSNCTMKFNMPVIPKGNMSVSKVEENLNDSLQGVEEYDFALMDGTGAPRAGETYNVVSLVDYSTINDEPLKTGSSGEFALKGDEMAVFNLMDVGTPVKVKETSTGQYTTTHSVDGGTRVDGKETGSYPVQKDYPNFVFYNAWDSADITVTKEVVREDGATIAGDPDYELTLKLGAGSSTLSPYKGAAEGATFSSEGKFTLKDGGTATIEDVPVGWTFTLSEAEPASTDDYMYENPLFTGKAEPVGFGEAQSYEIASGTNAVTVTNTYVPVPKFADLTIVKSGISSLDYHAASASGGEREEYQSTLYTVTGKADDGTEVSMEVAIHGNSSVTIADLPVGEYTVTEKASWSWRYGLKSIAAQVDKSPVVNVGSGSIAFDLTKDGETVTFDNERTRVQWLAGDNFVVNVFDSISTKKSGADFGADSAAA